GADEVANGDLFQLAVVDATLDIAGVVLIRGSFTFSTSGSHTVFAGKGLKLFVGSGPAWLAGGDLNPLARGLHVTGAKVGIVEDGDDHAVFATGAVELVGVPNVTLSGELTIRINV